jgi:hypothetical protein
LNDRPTHKIRLDVYVVADSDDAAGDIAVALYGRFAREMQEVDGVLWLFPVADIKPHLETSSKRRPLNGKESGSRV